MDNSQKINTLQTIAHFLIEKAKAKGVQQVEVNASFGHGFTTNVRLSEPEEVVYSHHHSVELTVYVGKRQGSVSTTDTAEAALLQLVEKACAISQFTDEDPCAGLADKEEMATLFPDLDLYHPWAITPAQALTMASECERIALSQHPALDNSEGAWVETVESFDCYANSHGFFHVEPSSYHSVGVSLIAKKGRDMERDSYYTVAVAAQDLWDIDLIAKEAAKRTVSRLGSRVLKTQKSPVIFVAEEARSLIAAFISAISGSALYRKSSFLLDALGKPIFPTFMRIHEDPYLKRGLSSTPCDNDGVQTRRNEFIRDGVLQSYAMGTYSARQLGLQSTANSGGVFNIFVESAQALSFAQLLKKMDTGLLVTDLMGQGTNIVTGDYSRGASGFWVERGEIQYPVHEITIAGNLPDMYQNIVAISNDVDTRSNIRTGSILIAEMMIAGQ